MCRTEEGINALRPVWCCMLWYGMVWTFFEDPLRASPLSLMLKYTKNFLYERFEEERLEWKWGKGREEKGDRFIMKRGREGGEREQRMRFIDWEGDVGWLLITHNKRNEKRALYSGERVRERKIHTRSSYCCRWNCIRISRWRSSRSIASEIHLFCSLIYLAMNKNEKHRDFLNILAFVKNLFCIR